ncbi:hypothetical protein JTE90_009292, partial [Oedothorax gibbosus]
KVYVFNQPTILRVHPSNVLFIKIVDYDIRPSVNQALSNKPKQYRNYALSHQHQATSSVNPPLKP